MAANPSHGSPYLQLPARPALGSDPGLLRPGSAASSGSVSGAWLSADPRTASTQSLTPSDVDPEPGLAHAPGSSPKLPPRRRTLLIVYIHGFYGNAQSFRSFPAHVHGFLKTLLSETHVIHSKIYPRYKCYRAIEVARDNFSAWLEPHTSPTTDVVLVGHSMGGLLAAEIILMPNHSPYMQHPFKHKILGSVALDSPFLGLHPGIIVSGISSLFQPAQSPPAVGNGNNLGAPDMNASTTTVGTEESGQSSASPGPMILPPPRQPTDPYFNPPFFNDAPFREQPFLKRLMNFATKHKSEGIFRAVGNHVTSHLEFASCLTDYPGMSARYNHLRALEDIDEIRYASQGHPKGAFAQVRFVNYYTLSSGIPKPPKTPKSPDATAETTESSPRSSIDSTRSIIDDPTATPDPEHRKNSASPAILDSKADGGINLQAQADTLSSEQTLSNHGNKGTSPEDQPHEAHSLDLLRSESSQDTDIESSQMSRISPTPEPSIVTTIDEPTLKEDAGNLLALPPLPDPPAEPVLPDPDQYPDKEARKQVEKERKRIQKAYEKALKDHAKAVREREKLLQKAQKEAAKTQQQQAQQQKAQQQQAQQQQAPAGTPDQIEHASAADTIAEAQALEAAKPKKQRKFCRLPSKRDGVMDPTWVDIYIDGVDEVGAHCGLFFPGPHYDKLVGDVGSRILSWVQDDLTKRAILDMS